MVLDIAEQSGPETIYVLAAIRLLLLTGLRRGEVRGLRWKDYDRERADLTLQGMKTGRRVVPLNECALGVIEGLPEGEADELVVASAEPGGRFALTRPLYRIRSAAGIDDTANLHCLLHAFASWAVMSGLSLAQTGALLEHRNPQTTLRYATPTCTIASWTLLQRSTTLPTSISLCMG